MSRRRKKKKRREESGPKGAPEWVVTFTDMISLLVTFFVLLMTFSSLDAYDALKVDSWLTGNKGLHKSRGWVMPDLPQDDVIAFASLDRGAHRPHSRPEEKLPEDIEEMGQKLTDEHVELDLNDARDGLVIEFGEEGCFEPGSTKISAELHKSLAEIGRVLENYPHLVVIEGFTDGRFHATPDHPDEIELSLSRAQAAADVLLAESAMNTKLMQLAGYGSAQPRADNESLGGRRLNRRVQIRILSLSKVRSTHLRAQRDEEARR